MKRCIFWFLSAWVWCRQMIERLVSEWDNPDCQQMLLQTERHGSLWRLSTQEQERELDAFKEWKTPGWLSVAEVGSMLKERNLGRCLTGSSLSFSFTEAAGHCPLGWVWCLPVTLYLSCKVSHSCMSQTEAISMTRWVWKWWEGGRPWLLEGKHKLQESLAFLSSWGTVLSRLPTGLPKDWSIFLSPFLQSLDNWCLSCLGVVKGREGGEKSDNVGI